MATHRVKSTNESLPRINSQKKMLRHPSQATERPTEEGTISVASLRRPKSQSDLQSARKALQSANSSKAVRLEATAVVYLKKIEALEKQQFLLDREMKQAKGEIEELRVRRKGGEEPLTSTVSSRCSSFLTKEGPKVRMETLRKKIDRQNERIKKVMGEVDKTRKEIQTMKKLNSELEKQLEEWTRKATAEQSVMVELEQKTAARTAEVQQKKLDDIHNKAHLVKNYDAILKKLDNELAKVPGEQVDAPTQFYLTDPVPVSSKVLPQQSPKSRKVAAQVTFLRQKVEVWKQQAEEIKEKVEAGSLDEVEEKLQEQHSRNFHQYNYLNERYSHLNQLKERHQEYQTRKRELTEQFAEAAPNKEKQQLEALSQQLRTVAVTEDKYRTEIEHIDDIYVKLRQFAGDFGVRTGHHLESEGEVTRSNLGEWLGEVLRVKNRLGMGGE